MRTENLESFYFKDTIDGVEHDYRITMNENLYEVKRDGQLIAELEHNTVWHQATGVPLPIEFIQELGDRIEDHYE